MSHARQRAQRRDAMKESRRTAFQAEWRLLHAEVWDATSHTDRIAATERFIKLIDRIAASDIELWPFVQQLLQEDVSGQLAVEEREEIRALIAQKVAPNLAGNTSGSVHCRCRQGS